MAKLFYVVLATAFIVGKLVFKQFCYLLVFSDLILKLPDLIARVPT